jgi:DNA-binding transcriptional ArsR family regulator
MNVGQLCSHLRVGQPTVSHHLGLLRMGDLVLARRDGKEVFYSLRPPRRGRASAVIAALLADGQEGLA